MLVGSRDGLRPTTEGTTARIARRKAKRRERAICRDQEPYGPRASPLAWTGSAQAAAEAYQRAIGLESDPAVRWVLQTQLSRV